MAVSMMTLLSGANHGRLTPLMNREQSRLACQCPARLPGRSTPPGWDRGNPAGRRPGRRPLNHWQAGVRSWRQARSGLGGRTRVCRGSARLSLTYTTGDQF